MSVTTLRTLIILSTTVFMLGLQRPRTGSSFRMEKVDGTYLGGSIQFRMNDGTVKSHDLSSIQWIYLSQKPATQAGTTNSSTSQPQSPAGPRPSPEGTNTSSAVVPSNTGSDVPQDQAHLAFDFHNQKRQNVGSPPLQWSTELAAYAQEVGQPSGKR